MRIDDPLTQQRIDQTPLMSVHLNPRSRDETVKMMRGLQAVYGDLEARQAILALIRQDVLGQVRDDVGRPGMDLWSIFVLLCCREALRLDYDRLEDLVENHRLVRAALGIGDWQQQEVFDWTRIWRNVRKVRAETVAEISRRVVRLGHQVAPEAPTHVRVDSFVMQTNVHHPSDIRQVADGLRVVLRHATRLAEAIGSTLLRQHAHLERRSRHLVLAASRASASRHRDREERLAAAVAALCDFADERCDQALVLSGQSRQAEPGLDAITHAQASSEHRWMMLDVTALATCTHVARERLVLGRPVALSDRLFSIFEPHTELIYRGKARAAVEFGHRVLVAEDAAGFIVAAEVMPNGQQDRDAAIPLVERLKAAHPALTSASFDRGFHSPENARRIADLLPDACLPNSGEKALAAQAASASASWTWQRRHHSGIEAAIGSLQDNRGCRRCPDKGRHGYARFLQTAVLASNLITLGRLCWAKDDPEALPARSRRKAA
ncbi:MAG: ISNCY family transposase [Planctomycetes bacterium]|nr:ISNCY family transposase [Planctomycetota bacterium]